MAMGSTAEYPDYGLPEGYTHVYSGKVRDLYTTPDDRLLFVASDRISAFDWVLPTEIPDKGRILTAMSLWWFDRLDDIVPNHVISARVPAAVERRAIICSRLDMFPIECVARGYLAGSALVEYRKSLSICGLNIPPGFKEGQQLPKILFTPATKAAQGAHDENITFDETLAIIGQDEAQSLRRLTLLIYERAEQISADRGLILADTKLEFGARPDGTIVLADEVLTPDSSRFWPADKWEPGHPQPSFDKQFVRDWLTSPESGWDRESGEAPPPLPDEVVEKTRAKYIDAYELLTGKRFV